MDASWLPDHLRKLRATYRTKRDVLVQALHATFGDAANFATPGGGMFIWAEFTHVEDTTRWLARCLDQGVCFVPGAAFGVDRDLSRHIRLSFSTGSVDELAQGVQRMASC